MKGILIVILAGFSLSSIVIAQDTTPQTNAPQQPSTQTSQQAAQQTTSPDSLSMQQSATPATQNQPAQSTNPRIAPGSVIPVQLTKTIDAKKIKTGDEIVAKVTQDLKTNTGEVVVPKDTKVVGHVTAAQPHSKEQKESEIGLAFDRAVLKDGSEMNMPLSVQAIIAPPKTNPDNGGGSAPPDQSAATPAPSSSGGRGPGMAGNTAQAPSPTSIPSTSAPTDAQTASQPRAPITGKTEGVVGIADLQLTTAAPNSAQGSLVTSEKNNVKLESGTFMLLRVNP